MKQPRIAITNGMLLFLLGVVHNLVGVVVGLGVPGAAPEALGGRRLLAEITGAGVVGAVEPDPWRMVLFWFLWFGLLVMVLGWFMHNSESEGHQHPRGLPWQLATIGLAGGLLIPVSGFWLVPLIAWRMGRGARRRRARATDEYRALPLEAHPMLEGVPLRDVTAVDLPGGGPDRTLMDLRALVPREGLTAGDPVVAGLFALRFWLGRKLGWDSPEHDPPEASYLARMSDTLEARSLVKPGTAVGGFRLLYVLGNEALAEVRNATVHAFLCLALSRQGEGYRLYGGVYVLPASWLTPLYMTAIEPFRRFIVYPALARRVRRAWIERYAGDKSGHATEATQDRALDRAQVV
jgi:hypothetical protein